MQIYFNLCFILSKFTYAPSYSFNDIKPLPVIKTNLLQFRSIIRWAQLSSRNHTVEILRCVFTTNSQTA
jgi:hypothetical protein